MPDCLSARASTASLFTGITLFGLLALPGFCGALDSSPRFRGKANPTTLEAFPHAQLSRGSFRMWCGRKDRFLLDVNGRLEAYDSGVKVATIAVSSEWPMQCSDDGQSLVYVDTRMGYVTRVEIGSGEASFLASYSVPERGGPPIISFSGDLRVAVVSAPLRLTGNAADTKVVLLGRSSRSEPVNQANMVKWSEDSSRFFAAYGEVVDVFDATGGKVGSVPLPKKSYLHDGWFDSGRMALILRFSPNDQQAIGWAVKCAIAKSTCSRIASQVDSVSVGGRGIIGTFGPLGKLDEPTDDAQTIYPRYAAELRDSTSKLLARQVYLTKGGRDTFRISVSPSGTKSIVTWFFNAPTAQCPPPNPEASYCTQGILIDLSKVLK